MFVYILEAWDNIDGDGPADYWVFAYEAAAIQAMEERREAEKGSTVYYIEKKDLLEDASI